MDLRARGHLRDQRPDPYPVLAISLSPSRNPSMHATHLLSLATAAVLAVPLLLHAEEKASPIPLKAGDRVVFLGDSITAAGAGPKGYISLIRSAFADKHKDTKVDFLGAGIQRQQGARPAEAPRQRRPGEKADRGVHLHWHQRRLALRTRPDPRHLEGEAFEAGLEDVIKPHSGRPVPASSCVRPRSSARRRTGPTRTTPCSRNTQPSAGPWPRISRCRFAICAAPSSRT